MMAITHERDRPQAENLAEVPFHLEPTKWAAISSRPNRNSPILKTLSEGEPVRKSMTACLRGTRWLTRLAIQISQEIATETALKPRISFTKPYPFVLLFVFFENLAEFFIALVSQITDSSQQ